ncbi:MAG: squalene/phytoene synthase family protein [Verrucomicrobiales bacterium]|nr:squalene/phytoene synthase family protein [Verrucomicrobiales bacterium]MED5584817.1 squalene/phytoene synthase family protein [Verrucomicrobiota bacterium]
MGIHSSKSEPARIASRAKSNLTLALACLPRERRRDMISFYAFCRVVDDIADDPDIPDHRRLEQLDAWEAGLREGFEKPDPVQAETMRICREYGIDSALLIEIVHGMKMDIGEVSYPTFEALKGYCYRVACVVGLVSLDIFGASHPASRDYALNLGYALQLTNILRDVAEDAAEGRLYLPAEDLERFSVNAEDILAGRPGSGFSDLMRFESERARAFFDAADKALPPDDRKALCAARRMSKIYRNILYRMIGDDFRVFEKRYRPGRLRTLFVLLFG